VCNFTVAVNRRYANAQGVREADFINCVAWRQQAEFVARYFTKGRKIVVEGSIQTRTYDAPDGNRRYFTEVVVDDVEFAESRPQGGESGGGYVPPSGPSASPREVPEYPSHTPASTSVDQGYTQIDDDDLPF
jgi:single-strand DNA-binding protein